MIKVFLKILLASIIAGIWHELDEYGNEGIALVIFIFVLAVLLMNPVKFQSPEKREEYIQKMREKKEQKLAIALKQKEERARLRKEKQERDEQAQKELQAKIRK